MKSKITLLRRVGLFAAALGIFLPSVVGLFYPAQTLAAGETYTWLNGGAITVSGGQLQSNATLSKNTSTLPGQPLKFTGFLTLKNIKISKKQTGACFIEVTLTLASNNQSGILSSAYNNGHFVISPGSPGQCPQSTSKSTFDVYNGTTVSIKGSPSNTGETTPQQTVDFKYDSSKPSSQSPSAITLTVKDQSDAVVKTLTLTRDDNLGAGSTDLTHGQASYDSSTNVQLSPGTYTACINPYSFVVDSRLNNGCATITKVSQIAGDYEWGAASQYVPTDIGIIDVAVNVIWAGGNTDQPQIGPYGLSLKGGPGNTSQVGQTNSQIPTPPPGSDFGTFTVNGTYTVTGTFTGVANGTYQICLADISLCQPVTMTSGHSDYLTALNVKFDLTGDQSSQLIAQTGKANSSAITCESNGFSLSWIMCPIVKGMLSAVDGINHNVIEPLLKTKVLDTTTTDGNKLFNVWSNLRVYGDIFLVIALLVVVFGESIGGGVIDAYTAKKVLPRLLFAAVLINLSYYIVGILVDVTNILGVGLNDLIAGPFGQAGALTLTYNGGTDTLVLGGLTFAGILAVAGSGALLEFLWAFVMLPALLTFIAIMVTVLLRRALILLLLILSPIAFALYVLPNTEQYFKRWWKILMETLLVFPIIEALFAISKVLAVTINWGGDSSGLAQSIAGVVSIAALVIPLFLIPFAFRIGGGILGKAHDVLMNYGKKAHEAALGNPNDPTSLRYRARHDMSSALVRSRAERVRSLEGSKYKPMRRFSRVMGLGDVMAKEAAINAEGIKRGEQVKTTGDDRYGRALTSIPLFLDESGKRTTDAFNADGTQRRRALASNGDGLRLSMAGNKTYTDTQYGKASELYKTQGEKQYWMDYEATKINSGETAAFKTNYLKWAKQEGFSDAETQGVYTGVAFSRQNDYLNLKYSAIVPDGKGGLKYADVSDDKMNFNADTGELGANDNIINDLYNKKGPYQTGQLSAEDMHRVYDIKDHVANQVRALRTKERTAGPLAEKDAARLKNAQQRLKQINNLETTWAGEARGGRPLATVTDEGTPVGGMYSGLSSGNQGVQDAFKQRAYDERGNLMRVNAETGERMPVSSTVPGAPGSGGTSGAGSSGGDDWRGPGYL